MERSKVTQLYFLCWTFCLLLMNAIRWKSENVNPLDYFTLTHPWVQRNFRWTMYLTGTGIGLVLKKCMKTHKDFRLHLSVLYVSLCVVLLGIICRCVTVLAAACGGRSALCVCMCGLHVQNSVQQCKRFSVGVVVCLVCLYVLHICVCPCVSFSSTALPRSTCSCVPCFLSVLLPSFIVLWATGTLSTCARNCHVHVVCGWNALPAFLHQRCHGLQRLLDVPATRTMFECPGLSPGDARQLRVCRRTNLLLVEFNAVSCSSRSTMEAGSWTGQGYSAPWMYHSMAGQYTWVQKSFEGILNSRGLFWRSSSPSTDEPAEGASGMGSESV